MRFIFLALLFEFGLAACSGNNPVSKKLSGSDSLVVNFFAPNTNSVLKTVVTAEKKAVNRLSEFISNKETEQFKCGYDGEMLFFEKGKQVSNVSFKYSDQACRHFLLDVEGKLTATKMSNEAADFLESLSKNEGIYW